MRHASESATLASLRAKTDRELIVIIGHTLERGLALLCRNTDASAIQQRRAAAERVHREALRLLPLVYDCAESDRHRLESELAELRSVLDACQAADPPHTQATSR